MFLFLLTLFACDRSYAGDAETGAPPEVAEPFDAEAQ